MKTPFAKIRERYLTSQIDASKERDMNRRAVARYSRGNISLMLGRYTTREQLEERKRQVLAVKTK